MTPQQLRAAATTDAMPDTALSGPLTALWWAARGDWDRAHEAAQAADDGASAWVHGYLHRVEGDLANADYWYRRAGRVRPSGPLEAEWATIAAALLPVSR